MKNLIRFTVGIVLFGFAVCPAQAALTSIHIFGDTVSTTTNSPGGTYYYGQRFSNGRVWVEVLAQELGVTNNYWYSNNTVRLSYTNLSAFSTNWSYSSNNWSFYGDYSSNLVKTLTNYPAPSDANTALFVVWVSDADFVYDVLNYGTNITQWTNAMNLSLTNHFKIITNLYAKGARTLIMPNAVDFSVAPAYQNYAGATNGFLRQRVIDFNAAFTTTLMNRIKTNCPGITIYVPDFFTLLDNILTNAAAYGLTNAGIDALDNPSLTNLSMTGPGANYIWWDNQDPTAKAHAVMASVAKQLILPAQISQITSLNGSNQLVMANVPIGLNGFVDGTTNLLPTSWTTVTNIVSTNATQTVVLPATDPMWFYRLRFPFSWSWP